MSTPLRVCVALALVTLATVTTVSSSVAAGPPALTKPVQATLTDQDPARLYSSPALAIDPKHPNVILAGYADLRSRRCGFARTEDGGRTWTRPETSLAAPGYPFCLQPDGGVIQTPMAFGGGGMVYMALNGWGNDDGPHISGAILLARSADRGTTWDTAIVRTGRGKTAEEAEDLRPVQSIAVDVKGGRDDVVYVTFALARPNATTPNAVPAQPMVAVSRDGGRTFGEALNLADKFFEPQAIRDQALAAVTTTAPATNRPTAVTTVPPAGSKAAVPNQAANFGSAASREGIIARVDAKGTAYVTWPTATANIAAAPPGGLALSKSTDGGRTWNTSLALPFSYENPVGHLATTYPQMVVSPTGALHVVFSRNPTPDLAGAGEVFHRASYDGGKTWTAPNALSDDNPNSGAIQGLPNLSVAPNGRIDVAWWDNRDSPGQPFNDVYYTYSEDDGKTWSPNQRITDQSVNRRFGAWGNNFDVTSLPGIASTNAYALIGWDDTRNSDFRVNDTGTLGSGLQDVYVAAAQFQGIGGSSISSPLVAAGLLGLFLGGLALLLMASASKRRRSAVGVDADATEVGPGESLRPPGRGR